MGSATRSITRGSRSTAGWIENEQLALTAERLQEENACDVDSRVTDYTVTLTRRPAYPFVTDLSFKAANGVRSAILRISGRFAESQT